MRFLFIFLFSVICLHTSCKSKTNSNKGKSVPQFIQDKIVQFSSEEVANPPRKIYQYLYNKQSVYLITAPCCDFFDKLVDSNGTFLCAPSGGITGKGDGKCKDFNTTATNAKLIWEDTRKSSKK